MFCSNCGNKVNDGAAFCANCGTALNSEPVKCEEVMVAQPVAETPAETPVAAPVVTEQPVYTQPPVTQPVAPVQPVMNSQPVSYGTCPTSKSVLIKGILAAAFACSFWLSFLGIVFGSMAIKEADLFARFNPLAGMAKIGRILGKVGLILGIVMTVILSFYIIAILGIGLA